MASSSAGEADLPYRYRWPRPAVTADCLIYTLEEGEPWILLIKRKNDPFKGEWALPGENTRRADGDLIVVAESVVSAVRGMGCESIPT